MGTVTRGATTAIVVAAALAMSLAGCSWRLDSPAPPAPSPDATELARNAAALAESRIIDSLADASPSGPGGEWLLTFENVAAPAHLDALGGVYEPYPGASPSPSTSPYPSTTPSSSPSSYATDSATAFVSATARARYTDFTLALTVEDPDLALLLASIGLSHAAALAAQADADARADGLTVDRAVDRVPPPVKGMVFGPLVPDLTGVPVETLNTLIVLHDEAQYTYEVIAARAIGLMRGEAYSRGLLHKARAKGLLALIADDPRGPSYVLPDMGAVDDLTTLRAIARDTESNLADAYLAAFADLVATGTPDSIDTPAERAWLLSGAYDALVASILWGDPPAETLAPGELPSGTSAPGDLSPFPGIAVLGPPSASEATPSPSAPGATPSPSAP